MAQRRAARRRRILAEQLRGEECRAEEQKEELLVKRLMRQTQQEQRAATQLLQVKRNKDVIRENRANKQKQLEEERRREFSEALDREAQLAEADKALYSEQVCVCCLSCVFIRNVDRLFLDRFLNLNSFPLGQQGFWPTKL